MARAIYQQTMNQPDVSGFLKALQGIEIGVYTGGTYGTGGQALATIYQGRTGGALGPAPEAAASGGPNPFTTGGTGAVEFWLEAGLYDIHVRDTQVPARIAERTIQWNAVAAVAGGIPGSWLARPGGDSGIDLSVLGDAALRQVAPIGQVIKWWRPNNTVAIPSGWVVCDGSVLASAAHDFGTGASITLPDLRNRFILGADPNIADGTAAVNADGAANAPGIRGAGGSQLHQLSIAQMPAHAHPYTDPGHYHSTRYNFGPGGSVAGLPFYEENGHQFDTNINTNPPAGSNGYTNITINPSGGGGSHNNTPSYVGLVMLMKVKRS